MADDDIATLELPAPDDAPAAPHQPCYRSSHGRRVVDLDGRSPGPVTLFHLWLRTGP